MPRDILPEPPGELKQLSNALAARLRDEITAGGPLPFVRFMERTLYEPGLGYYSAGLHKLGASGDFVTAPELGVLFAGCLARQVSEVAERLPRYDILEIGSGTGKLAVDLLLALAPEHLPERYFILETSADLRRVQRERVQTELPGQSERIRWLDQPPDAPWQGVLIANEVIDALPAERFRISSEGVEQMAVSIRGDRFEWAFLPAPDELEAAVRNIESQLGQRFPLGYRSEVRLQLRAWLGGLTRHMQSGLALFVDYGYPRGEYYLPERSDGTLMCHYRHRAHDDVFFWPGLQDITAWVDFTAMAEAADDCRLEVLGYTSQAMFLLGCGLEQVLSEQRAGVADGGVALSAEARQLTLPEMMGERFQAMGLGRNLAGLEPAGFNLQDLRYRL